MKLTKSTQISVKDSLDGVDFEVNFNVEYGEFTIKVGSDSIFLKGVEMEKLIELINKILASK